ncbi:DUF4131 domain-containing protein [Collimonas sp.]|jgi:competence protein ComEC|uniref:DUF4131 domain-containing protein n=1 Tax=Collimonas sp. TaxID=1963772 RepID=UPI0037BEC14D
MRSALVGFVLGVVFLQMQAGLCASWLLICLLVLPTAAFIIAGKARFRWLELSTKFIAGMLFGFAWAGLFAQYYLQQELPPEWEGRDITLIGVVDGLPSHFERGVSFTFAVERVLEQGGQIAGCAKALVVGLVSSLCLC